MSSTWSCLPNFLSAYPYLISPNLSLISIHRFCVRLPYNPVLDYGYRNQGLGHRVGFGCLTLCQEAEVDLCQGLRCPEHS